MSAGRLAAVLILIAVGLSGCWDRVEVNDLAVITLVGIDRADEGVRLTVAVMAPKQPATGGGAGGPGRATSYVVYTDTGTTVMDAVRRIQLAVPRRLFWGHTRVLVLGRDFARDGIRPAIDFWSRHREPRLLMHVAVAEGEAGELLRARPKLEQLLSEALRETINLRGFLRTRLRDLVIDLRTGGHPVLSLARLDPAGDGQQDVRIAGVALLRGDRLAGTLSDEEATGLEWVLGEVNRAVTTVGMPGGMVSFELVRARSLILPRIEQGRLRVQIQAEAQAKLRENTTGLDVGKEENLLRLRQELEKQITQKITEVVRLAQKEYRTDFLRLGDAVHRFMPVLWEQRLKQDWDRQFAELPVTVTVSVPIRETGATMKSQIRQ
ncbi:MAG TPA: Ger(x)C family spore germination protein [Symbiobacteriaceae bacterium]|nr:Ger(x)C family spore germination protein [Symbiobacteriaceae bacterium]